MDARVCMAESLRCLPEAIPTLLIGYTPIKNKKVKKKSFTFGVTQARFKAVAVVLPQ